MSPGTLSGWPELGCVVFLLWTSDFTWTNENLIEPGLLSPSHRLSQAQAISEHPPSSPLLTSPLANGLTLVLSEYMGICFVYVCIYVYTYVCMHMYMYVCTCTNVCLYECANACGCLWRPEAGVIGNLVTDRHGCWEPNLGLPQEQ